MRKLQLVIVVTLIVIGSMVTGIQWEKIYGSSFGDGFTAGVEAGSK